MSGPGIGRGSPKLAANLKWLFTELPFEQRFDAAAEAGFTGVEYPAPYGFEVATIRRWLAGAGVVQVLINSPAGRDDRTGASGIACHPDSVAEFRVGIDQALEYAGELGAPLVHVMAGVRPDDVSRDRAFARYVANIAWAADRARGSGITLLLEAQNKRDVPGFFLDGQAHAAAVVDAVGSDRVRLLLDVYHLQVDEGDVVTHLTEHLPMVGHLQIADPPHRSEPGTGELRWEAVFEAIRSSGYAGWIGCEYRPVADTLSGLRWREALGMAQ